MGMCSSVDRAGLRRWFKLLVAVDRHRQGCAHFLHAPVAQPAKTLRERPNRNTLHRVDIDSRLEWDRIFTGFEEHLTGKPSDCRRAWSY